MGGSWVLTFLTGWDGTSHMHWYLHCFSFSSFWPLKEVSRFTKRKVGRGGSLSVNECFGLIFYIIHSENNICIEL